MSMSTHANVYIHVYIHVCLCQSMHVSPYPCLSKHVYAMPIFMPMSACLYLSVAIGHKARGYVAIGA